MNHKEAAGNHKQWQAIKHASMSWFAMMTFMVITTAALFSAHTGNAQAQLTPDSIFNDAPKFLKVDQAFGFDFEQKDGKLIIKWDIADGYYLYKKQFKTSSKGATIGQATFPEAQQIEDEFFGLSDVFFDDMEIEYPIIQANQDGSVKLRFQGCAEAGLCYPPTTHVIFLEAYESSLLTPEQAFKTQISQQGDNIEIQVDIAQGYFVDKSQITLDTLRHELGEAQFKTTSTTSNDSSDVFYNSFSVSYPILSTDAESPAPNVVELGLAGCAEDSACFQKTTFTQDLDKAPINNTQALVDNSGPVSAQYTLAEKLLSDQSIFVSLGLLALLGLGLAFTPCVYPMYPILSSIVIGKGQKQIKTSHAFALSFVYVQGMAITYSIIGLIVASAGVQFQAALQHPALLGVFIVLFVLLALAMFGLYEIQLPQKWTEKLNNLSSGQKQGNYAGVFVMGVVSGLVASPCTTAPLTAVLIVVAQSDSLLFGFSALYALSIGMGIPLILFGVTGGKLLPKAGNWMNVIKVTFGFMMLTVAILFVERFVIATWTDLLWAALGLALFTYWYTVNQETQASFAKGVRTLVSITGLVLSILFTFSTLQKFDVMPQLVASNQLASTSGGQASASNSHSETGHPEFMVVRNLSDFEAKLKQANDSGQTVMMDLYADWCVACKEFEKYTFPDPAVIEALSGAVWMQIDLTDNTPDNLEFQKAYGVVGLPTIMFFDTQGAELTRSRVTGFMKANEFAQHARNTLNKN